MEKLREGGRILWPKDASCCTSGHFSAPVTSSGKIWTPGRYGRSAVPYTHPQNKRDNKTEPQNHWERLCLLIYFRVTTYHLLTKFKKFLLPIISAPKQAVSICEPAMLCRLAPSGAMAYCTNRTASGAET